MHVYLIFDSIAVAPRTLQLLPALDATLGFATEMDDKTNIDTKTNDRNLTRIR